MGVNKDSSREEKRNGVFRLTCSKYSLSSVTAKSLPTKTMLISG